MTVTAAAAPILLFLDIETIPSQDPAVHADIMAKFPAIPALDLNAVKADGRLKDVEKIEADLAVKREKATADHHAAIAKRAVDIDEAYRKTALDGSVGHLASIAWAFDEDVVVAVENEVCLPLDYIGDATVEDVTGQGLTIFAVEGHDVLAEVTTGEGELLEAFFEEIEDRLFDHAAAAHNAALDAGIIEAPKGNITDIEPFSINPTLIAHFADFDIRFIWQRAIALGVPVPSWWPHDAKPWDAARVQDTMTMWAGHGNRIGLDRLCRALGVPGKTDMDGSQVWDAVRAGRIGEVVEYNRGDVRRLRSVHRRMRGLSVLPIDIGDPVEVPDFIVTNITDATYVPPDAFVFDEASSQVRVIPIHAELTVTDKTDDGWTAEGVVVVDAPPAPQFSIREGSKTVDMTGVVYNPDAEPGDPVEAWQFPNGNRVVFDGRGNQVPHLQMHPHVDLPARCHVIHGTWEEFNAYTGQVA